MSDRLDRMDDLNWAERMDVLADVVSAMRTGPAFSGQTELAGPWGLRFTQAVGAQFHVVIHGSCWLLPPDEGTPLALAPGDVVLLPQGLPHAIADHPKTPLIDVLTRPTDEAIFPPGPATDGMGARAVVLCGVYQLNRERPHPLFQGPWGAVADVLPEGRSASG